MALFSTLARAGARRADRFLGRSVWYRRVRHPAALVREIRPTRTHWSGVTLRCWRHGDRHGSLRVTVWQLSPRGPVRVRTSAVPLAAVDDGQPCPVYWEPIEHARGARFFVTARQVDPAGRQLTKSPPLTFSWRRDSLEPVYSNPEPDVPFPRAMLVSPVTQCNLNCIHCISRHSRDQLSVLSDDEWASLAKEAAAGRLLHVRTDYSGDLLFADRRHGGWLDRMMSLGIPFAITTHANDLTADYTERLMRSKLFSINFSLDSLDPDDYPRIRRGARPLREVVENIRRFMIARNKERPDIETILSFVLMRRNLDSLWPAIDLAAELGVNALMGAHLHVYTSDMTEESLLLDPARYARAYFALIARARARGVSLGLPPPVTAAVAGRRSHMPCPYPWSTSVLLGNGDVMACCMPGTKVGNIREGGFERVWNGPAMREFRRRVNTDTPPEPCTVCPMLPLEKNFAAFVPGLPEAERQAFERRCLDARAADTAIPY
jgi:radical SAM protein with 4Fe4S-binding SPASM domain